MRNELKVVFSNLSLVLSYLSLFFLYFKKYYKQISLKPEYIFILLPMIWAIASCIIYIVGWERDSLWDINVVYCADLAYSNGLNPYNDWSINPLCQESIPLQFTYLKLVLDVLPFSNFEYNLFEKVWVVFLGILIVAYAYVTNMMFKLRTNIFFNILFILVLFQGANIVALQAGNISALVYLLVLLAIYFYQSKSNKIYFFLLIALATFVKFHLGILLLLPFIIDQKFDYKGYLTFFSVLFGLFFLNYLIHGSFISQWIENLAYTDWGLKPWFSDISMLKPLWIDRMRDVEFNAIFKVLLAPFFIVNLIYFKKVINNKFSIEERNNYLIVLCCLVFILVLPRLKVYDFLIISCVSLKIYSDCITSLFNKEKLLRFGSLAILIIFYSSITYWRPQWDGSNTSYYYCFALYVFYQYLVYYRAKMVE